MNRKKIVTVGVLVLFVVVGAAGSVVADQPPAGVSIDQTPGEVEIVIVAPGNADSLLLKAPNGNRSIPLKESHGFGAGTSITIVETKENRTVPAENYLATGAIKAEEQTCWVRHGGLELGDNIGVNHSVDIPCNGGEIAGAKTLNSTRQSDGVVLIEQGQNIEYQKGIYEIRVLFEGEIAGERKFTIGSDEEEKASRRLFILTVLVVAGLSLAAVAYKIS